MDNEVLKKALEVLEKLAEKIGRPKSLSPIFIIATSVVFLVDLAAVVLLTESLSEVPPTFRLIGVLFLLICSLVLPPMTMVMGAYLLKDQEKSSLE